MCTMDDTNVKVSNQRGESVISLETGFQIDIDLFSKETGFVLGHITNDSLVLSHMWDKPVT